MVCNFITKTDDGFAGYATTLSAARWNNGDISDFSFSKRGEPIDAKISTDLMSRVAPQLDDVDVEDVVDDALDQEPTEDEDEFEDADL